MTALKFKGDLTFIGTADALAVRRLPLIRLPWLDEGPALLPVLMGRNGRPRSRITLPGHNRGVRPANTGKSFAPEPLSNEEALSLFRVIPVTHAQGAPNRTGIRDRALLTLLWRTGLRISEALDLKPHHVDFQTRRVTVLFGKGGKRRIVGIDAGGLMGLQPWLMERAMLGIPFDAPLFCTVQRPGIGNRIYPAYVRAKLHEFGRLAGIPKRVHPHLFRHSLACSMMEEGFSILDVQAQLGHSNPATTAIYLRGFGKDKAFERVSEREWPGGER